MGDRAAIKKAEKRYWPKVIKGDGCWEWSAWKSLGGYGCFTLRRRYIPATHFALLIEGSDVPSGMCVCHSCDNPGCVNPDHLWVGTVHDNMADRNRKGRNHMNSREQFQKMAALGHIARRSLTEDQIREIRASTEVQSVTAKKYGISQSHVSEIKLRKKYAHVK